MQSDQDIHRLVDQLIRKVNWGSVKQWSTQDFEVLSQQILDSTSVSLSVTTLKRLVGKVEYNSKPTITTLNAVASFLGYNGWRSFVQTHQKGFKPRTSPVLRKKVLLTWTVSAIALAAVIFAIFSFNESPEKSFKNNPPTFEIEKVTSGIPNSVIFRYNVAPGLADIVEIQQDWDATKRHVVDPEKNVFTHYYEYPGYYNTKLVLDGHIVAQRDLFIPSDGWMAVLSYQDQKPRYLEAHEFTYDTILRVTDAVEQIVVDNDKPAVLNYYNALKTPAHDFKNFELKTRVKFTRRSGQEICEFRRIVIFGTKMSMKLPLAIKGCISNLKLRIGDLFIAGEEHDLSKFGVEPGQPADLRVKNINNTLIVYVNDQLAFEHKLTDDFGKLAGLRFAFYGAGEVESVELTSEGETLIVL